MTDTPMGDWVNKPKSPNTEDQEPQQRLNVNIPVRIHKALKQQALDEDTTTRALVMEALAWLLKNDATK